jgi:hypothetical protein
MKPWVQALVSPKKKKKKRKENSNFKMTLSSMNKLSKQKINKETAE